MVDRSAVDIYKCTGRQVCGRQVGRWYMYIDIAHELIIADLSTADRCNFDVIFIQKLSPSLLPTRGKYRFTVYIENWYFKIDICNESIKSVSKQILIINVNGQKLFT